MDNFFTTQDFKFVSIAEIPIGARNHLPMDRVTLLNLNVISQTHWILRGQKSSSPKGLLAIIRDMFKHG